MSFPSEEHLLELDQAFPPDPTQPSPSVASSGRDQITLPWSKAANGQLLATLGRGCHSTKLESNSATAPFQTEHALSDRTQKENLQFRSEIGAASSFHKAITSDQTSRSEHLSVTGTVSAGCKFANVSGTGKYNKSVVENTDDMKASVQATIRTGAIYFNSPQLSLDAIADTRRSRQTPSTFTDKYGDYYVAALHLGADAGVLVSTSTAHLSESESLDVQTKLHVLWWDVETNHHHESHSDEDWAALNITAFDTLTESNNHQESGQSSQKAVASDYIQRVSDLDKRVLEKMEKCGLGESKAMDEANVRKICESGLVSGVTLLPYSQLRDYVRVVTEQW